MALRFVAAGPACAYDEPMRGAAVAVVTMGALLVAGCGGSSRDPVAVAGSLRDAVHHNDRSLHLRNVVCHEQSDAAFNCQALLEYGHRSADVIYSVQINRDGTFLYRAES